MSLKSPCLRIVAVTRSAEPRQLTVWFDREPTHLEMFTLLQVFEEEQDSPWIPLGEKVPPYETEVLTTDGTYCNVAERTQTTKSGEIFKLAGQDEADGERETVSVTHWRELPALPAKALQGKSGDDE